MFGQVSMAASFSKLHWETMFWIISVVVDIWLIYVKLCHSYFMIVFYRYSCKTKYSASHVVLGFGGPTLHMTICKFFINEAVMAVSRSIL